MSAGFIYILINACIPGAVKIGKTTRSPEDRAKEVSQGTGVPTPYVVALEEDVLDCDAAEREIHLRLAEYRISEDREFFRLPLKEAIKEVQKVAEEFRGHTFDVNAEEARGGNLARTQLPSKVPSVLSIQSAAPASEFCCKHCQSPLPSQIRGLYYTRCPKCGKTSYTKA